MDTQQIQKTKKISKATLILTLACTVVALAMTISGFLPIMEIDGVKVGIWTAISEKGFVNTVTSEGFMSTTLFFLPQTVAIVWSAIPKKWAAVVGTVYAALLAAWSFVWYSFAVSEETLTMLLGSFVFRNCASLLLLVLSVAKIVTSSMDKKKEKQTTE